MTAVTELVVISDEEECWKMRDSYLPALAHYDQVMLHAEAQDIGVRRRRVHAAWMFCMKVRNATLRSSMTVCGAKKRAKCY